MIRITRDAGIRTGMSTNATLLDDKRADMLLDSGLDYVILAFDGATKETYEKYRIGATFEKTRENILEFSDEEAGAQVEDVRRAPDGAAEGQHPSRSMRIGNCGRFRASMRFVSSATRFRSKVRRFPAQASKASARIRAICCGAVLLYVRYDGLAYPCCYMYDEPPVGDLKKQIGDGSVEFARRWSNFGKPTLQGDVSDVSALPDVPGRASSPSRRSTEASH